MSRAWPTFRTTLAAVAFSAFLGAVPAHADRPGEDLLREVKDALAHGGPPRPSDRCLTPLVQQVHERWDTLDPEIRTEIDRLLHPHTEGGLTYVSPLGHFSLSYVTAGPDSVPDTDIDPADGVPDFVERCATYADRAWTTEIDSLGFMAPQLPPDGTYDIEFMGLPAYHYGYTEVVDGTTHIVLHHNFVQGFGWPGPNDDPDGTQLGRAKVTIAHEFKHASQYTNSAWSEGRSWCELDGMWMEDIVFPIVNEYRYWLGPGSNSQLDAPWVSLFVSDSTGYEDCLWQHYMSGTWGAAVVHDYWARRALFQSETALQSYQQTLMTRASNWPRAYAGYMEWCWFTGSRAVTGLGFPDAAELPRMELTEYGISEYPCVRTGTVAPLACQPRRYNVGTATGWPHLLFDGADSSTGLVLSVVGKNTDGTIWILEPPLGPGNTCNYLLPLAWSGMQYFGVLVTNGDPWSGSTGYELDITDDQTVGAPAVNAARVTPQLLASPNPARDAVTFSLSLPRAAAGSLRIVDVSGRAVRTLQLAPGAERRQVRWDARDDAGRPLPAGVYWAETNADGTRLVRRVTLVR